MMGAKVFVGGHRTSSGELTPGGDPMARNVILALGALAWTVLAVSMIVLYSVGHWVAPTVTIIAGMGWVAIRMVQLRLVRRRVAEAA